MSRAADGFERTWGKISGKDIGERHGGKMKTYNLRSRLMS